MSGATIRRCTIADLENAPNIDELLAEYAAEAGMLELGQAVPQWWLYRKMESTGLLHVIGAFVDDKLVGFINLVVMQRPHYEGLIASYESFFVADEYRSTGAGTGLLRTAEALSKSMGALGLFVNAAIGSRLERMLDASPAYRNTHRVFFREFQ
mgnify:CR=1 FL=1